MATSPPIISGLFTGWINEAGAAKGCTLLLRLLHSPASAASKHAGVPIVYGALGPPLPSEHFDDGPCTAWEPSLVFTEVAGGSWGTTGRRSRSKSIPIVLSRLAGAQNDADAEFGSLLDGTCALECRVYRDKQQQQPDIAPAVVARILLADETCVGRFVRNDDALVAPEPSTGAALAGPNELAAPQTHFQTRIVTACYCPARQFGPFMIPPNVNELLLLSSTEGSSSCPLAAVGTVNAGDVAGVPHLPFVVAFAAAAGGAAGSVFATKRYAEYNETRGVEVALELVAERAGAAPGGSWSGTWTNASSGAFGPTRWFAQPQLPSPASVLGIAEGYSSLSVFHCAVCRRWRSVGAPAVAPSSCGGAEEAASDTLAVSALTSTATASSSSVLLRCLDCAFPTSAEPTCEEDLDGPLAFLQCGDAAEGTDVTVHAYVFNGEAQGPCVVCGLHDAVRRFANRPLLLEPSNGAMIAYSAVAGAAQWLQSTFPTAAPSVKALPPKRGIPPPMRGNRAGAHHRQSLLIAGDTNTAAHAVLQLAAVYLGYVVVPLPPAVGVSDAAMQRLQAQLAASGCPAAGVVQIDGDEVAPTSGLRIVSCPAVGELAAKPLQHDRHRHHRCTPDDATVALLFTSGSSSAAADAKPVVFTADLARPSEGLANCVPFVTLDFQRYDPTHVLSLLQTARCGGARVITSTERLFEDFISDGTRPEWAPSHVGAPPAVWQAALRQGGDEAAEPAKAQPFGSRLLVASSGGAPLAPGVANRAKQRLGVGLTQLYGCREAGGIAKDGVVYPQVRVLMMKAVDDADEGAALRDEGPGEICVSSPRMATKGYLSLPAETTAQTKDEGGTPQVPAFFEVNGDTFYRTGDIGMLWCDPVTGARHLTVHGRAKAARKLPNGEWLADAAVEAAAESHPDVIEACLMPSRTAEGPGTASDMAICCRPSSSAPVRVGGADGDDTEPSVAALIDDVRTHMLRSGVVTKDALPSRVTLYRTPLAMDSAAVAAAAVTGNGKRAASSRLSTFFHGDETRSWYPFAAVSVEGVDGSGRSTNHCRHSLHPALVEALDKHGVDAALVLQTAGNSGGALAVPLARAVGLDSLSFVHVVASLRQRHPDAAAAWPGLAELTKWTALDFSEAVATLETLAASKSPMHSVRTALRSIGGGDAHRADTAAAAAERHWRFFDSELARMREQWRPLRDIPRPEQQQQQARGEAATVLVGATGFLGTAILAELLLASASTPGITPPTVTVATARGSDPEGRIRAAMHRAGFGAIFDAAIASSRLLCCHADLATHAGKDEAAISDPLAIAMPINLRVSVVVCNAAAVSHTAPYSQLRGTNVVGPLRCLRWASEVAGAQRFVFVSSIAAVPPRIAAAAAGNRPEPFTPASTSEIASRHTDGYGQSKMVAEALLHLAVSGASTAMSLSIVRPSLIAPACCRRGGHGGGVSGNPSDTVGLLIRTCVAAGVAPITPGGPERSLDLRAVPLDVVARVIAAAAASDPDACHDEGSTTVFNVVARGPRIGAVFEKLVATCNHNVKHVPEAMWRSTVATVLADLASSSSSSTSSESPGPLSRDDAAVALALCVGMGFVEGAGGPTVLPTTASTERMLLLRFFKSSDDDGEGSSSGSAIYPSHADHWVHAYAGGARQESL